MHIKRDDEEDDFTQFRSVKYLKKLQANKKVRKLHRER
jgi:hypothetical protein